MLGDGHCVYIPFTVTAPQGTKLKSAQEYLFDVASFSTDVPGAAAVTVQPLPAGQAAENQLRFVLMASVSAPLSGQTAQIELWNMYHNSASGVGTRMHDEDAVVPGHFSFAFRLEYEPAGLSLLQEPGQCGLRKPVGKAGVFAHLGVSATQGARCGKRPGRPDGCARGPVLLQTARSLPILSWWDIERGAAACPAGVFRQAAALSFSFCRRRIFRKSQLWR